MMMLPSSILPLEILDVIVSHIPPDDQEDLHTFCFVSRGWYSAGIGYLYRYPKIGGRNFDLFVRSICPSVNLHVRRNGLGDLVRILDMGQLVHNGSKSLTARILNRVKSKLEIFVAPTATFGTNCLCALAKCKYLRELDLSLASQGALLHELLQHLNGLPHLRTIRFPRAREPPRSLSDHKRDPDWPPNVEEIHLNGVLNFDNLNHLRKIPSSTSHLIIESWQPVFPSVLDQILESIGSSLKYLRIDRWSGTGYTSSLPPIIHRGCPQLMHLRIVADYFFAPLSFHRETKRYVPRYARLDLMSMNQDAYSQSASALNDYDDMLMELMNLLCNQELPNLRKLGVDRWLGWTDDIKSTTQLRDIDLMLKKFAHADGERASTDAGVVVLK